MPRVIKKKPILAAIISRSLSLANLFAIYRSIRSRLTTPSVASKTVSNPPSVRRKFRSAAKSDVTHFNGLKWSNEDEDSNVRYTAASALRLAPSPTTSVVGSLIHALKDKEERIRRVAAESLLCLDLGGNDVILTLLLGALQDKSPLVRFNAAAAMSRVGPKAELAVESLIRSLADEDWRVRRIARETLGSIGPAAKSAIGPLLKVLEDPGNNDWVRSNAALALARIGPQTEAVVGALSSALNDGSQKVRNAAGQALQAISMSK